MTLSEYLYENIYKKNFGKTWSKLRGGVLLAFLNILLFLFIMPIGGVYPAMADWGIWTYRLLGLNIQPPWGSLELPHKSIISVLNFGLILGFLSAALLTRQFKIRKDTAAGYLQGFIGGALMGIGSFMVGACIIGGFYSAIMSLSLSGFYMMGGLIIGGYFGGRVLMWQGRKKARKLVAELKILPKTSVGVEKEYKSRQPMIGTFMLIVLFAAASIYFLMGKNLFGGIILFGAAFGLVIQRSAFCLCGAFREIFTTKKNETMRSLMISLAIGVVGFTIIKANGFRSAEMFVLPLGWHSIIGGAIFGFGMVITGG
ncbi:MAG: YeeE/YedE family protein [Nitrospirae bacterium]|nr:YeeE/YedE family protein [Nitrospirota bacterium]